ncbi:MAG: PAS domain-containing protein [Methylotenera sp.]|uniref:PAS domain-containing protein n=1 Tax=Methylotenera sp. TaxID=2051956 RepID=UPI00248A3836|nr:PAS domain-containing protein [Methylotenera sp.]MDI1310335.1 PAS domain-containing protein [Methylotenera sp.]
MHKSLFGVVVKKIRLEHGLTQESLASKSGLERTFISMLERGIKQPSLKTISSLAHAVGMKSYELLHMAEHAIHQAYSELTPLSDVAEDQRLFDALELEREKTRIDQIMNSMPIIFFARTPMPEYAATFVSKNINQLFGYDRDNFMAHSGFWHAHIHENDLAQVVERLKTLDVDKTLNHEYRFLTESGNWLLVREELKLIANESGAPKEVIGSIVGVSMC